MARTHKMEDTTMENQGGLRTTTGNPIPLEGVEVEGEILGGHARMKVFGA